MVRPRGRPRKIQVDIGPHLQDVTATVPLEAASIARVVCGHPSGFLFQRRVSRDWEARVDLHYCPHCMERRQVLENGKTIAACAAGGEWGWYGDD